MKAHDLLYVIPFSLMILPATAARAQNQESQQQAQLPSMLGKKYTAAEDLGMFDFFSAIVSPSHLIVSFTTSETQFDAKHIRVFLVESKGVMEERTIIDELIIDRTTDDAFSYVPIYDRRSDTKKEYFARYFIDGAGQITLKEIYEFDPDNKKIIAKLPVPGMVVQLDEL